jgi:DNA-directed RNA polymerase II subunit RPB2
VQAGAMNGAMGDATPFNGRTVEDIAAELEALGAERYGNEVMYNPRSGEQVACSVFVCPTYYQRLKHMVEDKVHSRAANGPVVLLTRQPAEGRARDGGLRLGEMELECLWAHGTMYFLKERFMECSDNYRIFVCRKCGMMATVNPERNIYLCKACKNITEFAEVRVPYASKLLMQEVQTMAIGTYIST